MLITVKEKSLMGKTIDCPDEWTHIVPKEFPVNFSTVRTINGHKQIIADRYSLDTKGYLGNKYTITINEFYPGDYSFSISDTEFLVGMTLSEVKKVVSHYLQSWQGTNDKYLNVGLIPFEDLKKFKEDLVNKDITGKDTFAFQVKIMISEKGKNYQDTITIPAIKYKGLALHREIGSINYVVSHIATTEAICKIKSVKDGRKVMIALTETGINWNIDNHSDMQDEAVSKGLKDILTSLSDKNIII